MQICLVLEATSLSQHGCISSSMPCAQDYILWYSCGQTNHMNLTLLSKCSQIHYQVTDMVPLLEEVFSLKTSSVVWIYVQCPVQTKSFSLCRKYCSRCSNQNIPKREKLSLSLSRSLSTPLKICKIKMNPWPLDTHTAYSSKRTKVATTSQ